MNPARVTKRPLRVIEALRRYSEVRDFVVEAGFPGELREVASKGSDSDQPPSVLEVATKNEFGDGERVPARPFMRQTMTRHRATLRNELAIALRDYGNGRGSLDKIAARVGVMLRGSIQETITYGTFVPNAPYTIAKKGSSKPLIDTGQMRQSVRWRARLARRSLGAGGAR